MAVTKNRIIEQAQKFTAKGQLEKAIAEYHKLLETDPNDMRTWLKVGDLYTRMGSRKEATETYLKVAERYTSTGFHLKAVAVYKQIIKLDPTLFEIHRHLAEAYSSLGLTSEALLHLEQLADTYQRMNRPQQMLGVLEMMANVDPHNIATRLRIAEYLSKEGRTQEAVMHFREVCEELRGQRRTNDFLKVAERLLFHDNSQVSVAREAAALYLETGQFKSALTKLQLCFAKEPQNLRTLEMLADAFRGLRQPDKAVSVYKEMALLLREQGKEGRRRQVLEMVLELDPKNRTALDALGRRSLSISTRRAASSSRHASLPAETFSSSEALESEIPPEEGFTEEELETQSRKLITESEVLLKYGLKDRAIEHLQKALNFDPLNIV